MIITIIMRVIIIWLEPLYHSYQVGWSHNITHLYQVGWSNGMAPTNLIKLITMIMMISMMTICCRLVGATGWHTRHLGSRCPASWS